MMENKLIAYFGAFFASCFGCSWVIHANLLAEGICTLASTDINFVKEHGYQIAMRYIDFGFGLALIMFFHTYLFDLQGNFLAKRYRNLIYEKLLQLDMSYYDLPAHSPGVLLTKLSTDSTQVNTVALGMFGVTIRIIVSSILGVAVSITFCWKIGLINLVAFPILLYLSGVQWKLKNGFMNMENADSENKAASILFESICNTKTIFSYNMQDKVVDMYTGLLKHRQSQIIKQGLVDGALFGAFQFALFADYTTLLITGAHFMIDPKDPVSFQSFLKSMSVSILTAFGLGSAQIYVGKFLKEERH
jgi:ATP-binding cassette subfamily B (MDR/TAP) protein 1